ncbi:MAG: glycoside hydrolase family 6 protein [Solirubrobacteraceae bacterium]
MNLTLRAAAGSRSHVERRALSGGRRLRLGALALSVVLVCGAGSAAIADAAAPPALLVSSPLLSAGLVEHSSTGHGHNGGKRHHKHAGKRHRHQGVDRRAPKLTQKGMTLTWSALRGVSAYVVREVVTHGKKKQIAVYYVVKGTQVDTHDHAGRTVAFRVRARVKGAHWSAKVLIHYPAVKKPRPTTSGTSGQAAPSVPVPVAAPSGDPIAGQKLYVDPNSDAVQAMNQATAAGQTANAALLAKIADQPRAEWFGDWISNPQAAVGSWVSAAAAAGAEPVIVAYDLPWLDCGGYSAGGASSPAAYEAFINGMVAGLAGRRAVVIVEPDALAEVSCLSSSEQASYFQLLTYAVDNLTSDPLAAVYLDSGNSGWQSAATMASRLQQAGIAKARGFSLNVSNFDTTASETAYGEAINSALGGSSHFVIDTSRNGQGPGSTWCNPPGRGLGTPPTANTGNSQIDAYLWIKDPGESDGTCNGGPGAGQWWTSYALGLASNAAS